MKSAIVKLSVILGMLSGVPLTHGACNFLTGPLGNCQQPADCGFGSYPTGAGPNTYSCYTSGTACCSCIRYELYCQGWLHEFTVNVAISVQLEGYYCDGDMCRRIDTP